MTTKTITTEALFGLLGEEYSPTKFINISSFENTVTYTIGDLKHFKEQLFAMITSSPAEGQKYNEVLARSILFDRQVDHAMINNEIINQAIFDLIPADPDANPMIHLKKVSDDEAIIFFTMSKGIAHGFDEDNVNIDIAKISNIRKIPVDPKALTCFGSSDSYYTADPIVVLI